MEERKVPLMSVLKERNRRRKSGNINVFLLEGCHLFPSNYFPQKFKILFPPKRHCNILGLKLLVCFPKCRLLQSVYYLCYLSLDCDIPQALHHKSPHFGTAIGYATWLLRLFTAIQQLLQWKEHILGKIDSTLQQSKNANHTKQTSLKVSREKKKKIKASRCK